MSSLGNQPLVSVVIPTRDRRAMLAECLASVVTQTYRSWEVVIVDDGSTDDTSQWLAEKHEARIRSIRLDGTKGRSFARNEGFTATRGRYVLFLDDDDRLTPNALSNLVQPLHRGGRSVVCVGGQRDFDDAGHSKRFTHPALRLRFSPWRELLLSWNSTPGRALIDADALRRVGSWKEGLEVGEDRELLFRLALDGTFVFRPSTVLEKRVHERQSRPEGWKQIRDQTLSELADTLTGRRHSIALRALEARREKEVGDDHYVAGRLPEAARSYRRTIALFPRAAWSPLTAPDVTKKLVKASVGRVLGKRSFLWIRALRWRLRSLVFRAPGKPAGSVEDHDKTSR